MYTIDVVLAFLVLVLGVLSIIYIRDWLDGVYGR